jgi:hypothetical protein
MGCPSNIFYQTTCKRQAWGAAKDLFCRNIMEACEAREYGSDSKRKHQVEGAICKQRSGREFWKVHAVTKQNECAREEPSQEEERGKSLIQLFVRVL